MQVEDDHHTTQCFYLYHITTAHGAVNSQVTPALRGFNL